MASTCSSFWRAAETHRKPRLPALAKGAEKPYQRGLPAPYPAGSERGRSSGVEHDLAKVGVEGSNPFARSNFSKCSWTKSRRLTQGCVDSRRPAGGYRHQNGRALSIMPISLFEVA